MFDDDYSALIISDNMADMQLRFPDRDEMFEKYFQLSRESERLKHRISGSASSSPDTSYYRGSADSTPASRRTSYTRSSTSRSPRISPRLSPQLSNLSAMSDDACPTPPLPGAALSRSSTMSDEEALLFECNQQIKATLTELLNCATVKQDQSLRAWVQERLMQAEHDLRRQRRRRSSIERDPRRMS